MKHVSPGPATAERELAEAGAAFVVEAAPTTMAAPLPLDPHLFGAGQPCFGCDPEHPIGFRLRFERDGDEVVTRFLPTERYQGPPGVMHGGLVTTLADEIAAWTVIGLRERMGFTGALEGRLLQPLRIGVEVEGRGRIARETPRVLKIAVEIKQREVPCFRGEFTFVVLDRAGAERLMGGPLPEAWARFAR
jgi:acyl-coenzyme A thioesterase PaaI-like protein